MIRGRTYDSEHFALAECRDQIKLREQFKICLDELPHYRELETKLLYRIRRMAILARRYSYERIQTNKTRHSASSERQRPFLTALGMDERGDCRTVEEI